LKFTILTIFPDFFTSPLKYGVVGRAIKSGLIEVEIYNLRDFTKDLHRSVDDRPFGGGAGMIMKIESIYEALTGLKKNHSYSILLSAGGKLFDQKRALELSKKKHLILICGRYEGVDERVAENLVDEELSVGNYVLSGGEPAALVILDSVSRLIPGVLGKEEALREESFSSGLLEYPQYTRPRDFKGFSVPEVLFSGDHGKIEEWRRKKALEKTLKNRPELIRRDHEKAHGD